ncbi:MAG: relaxase/mobilization nuclease domain-containing protein [Planctomycetota bacterium]
MFVKIHPKGASHTGLGRYILHDKESSDTSERVSFTDTRNIAVDDPHLAVRIMAATAMDQHRLKAEAGVDKRGNRSNKTVLHVTLSWRADEAEGLSIEEQKRAAYGALKALGADEHQALIVGHTDEEHPNVHLQINRVSHEDGRILSSSKDKIKLSKWAQKYEEERGQVLCHERVINNAARDRGEYVKAEPDVPRHIYEQRKANDNAQDLDSRRRAIDIAKRQREKDRSLGREHRATRERQRKALLALDAAQKAQRAKVRAEIKARIGEARNTIREGMRDRWKQRYHERQAELRAFEKNEQSFAGRMKNRLSGVDWRAMVTGGAKAKTIGETFGGFASRGSRRERLEKEQDRLDRELKAQQTAKEKRAAAIIRQEQTAKLAAARTSYAAERSSLKLKHAGEEAAHRAQWRERARERKAEWEKHREATKGRDIRDVAKQARQRSRAANPQTGSSQTGRPKPQSDTQAAGGHEAKQEALRRYKTRRAAQKGQQKDHDKEIE